MNFRSCTRIKAFLTLLLVLLATTPARATPVDIVGFGTGLSGTGVTTIIFSGATQPTTGAAGTGTLVSANQGFNGATLSNYGVTFVSTYLVYDTTGAGLAASDTNFITNWFSTGPTSANPFVIEFSHPVSAADFHADTNSGTSTFTFLDGGVNGTQVASFAYNVAQSENNFYGLSNALFDTISITVGGASNALDLGTLQFVSTPEPGTAWLIAGTLTCLLLRKQRSAARC